MPLGAIPPFSFYLFILFLPFICFPASAFPSLFLIIPVYHLGRDQQDAIQGNNKRHNKNNKISHTITFQNMAETAI